MGKNQIRKQIVGVAESHTHSAQKLQKTRKKRLYSKTFPRNTASFLYFFEITLY